MALWLTLALLTGGVLAIVIAPLFKLRAPPPSRASYDRAIYRDQLKELDRDVARGLVSEQQATGARIEIERRLLTAGEAGATVARSGNPKLAATAVAALVTLASIALYVTLGSPGVGDQPLALRTTDRAADRATAGASQMTLDEAATRLEEKLKQDPGNGDNWLLLARTYSTTQRWADAARAYQKAVELSNTNPDVLAAYGEMVVLASNRIVTPQAKNAFSQVLTQDPKNAVAHYYLGLADAQAGNTAAALKTWQQLAAESPADAPWMPSLRQQIADAARSSGVAVPEIKAAPAGPAAPPAMPPPAQSVGGAAPRGPNQEQIAAAAGMNADDRTAMIKGMVANLASRLQENPSDLEGWMRLGRAYQVLGDPAKSADAYAHAASLKPGDTALLLEQADALTAAQQPNTRVSPEVVAVLQKVVVIDPKQPKALWLLGLAESEAGHPDKAAGYWRDLLAQLPPNSEDYRTVSDALKVVAPGK